MGSAFSGGFTPAVHVCVHCTFSMLTEFRRKWDPAVDMAHPVSGILKDPALRWSEQKKEVDFVLGGYILLQDVYDMTSRVMACKYERILAKHPLQFKSSDESRLES